MAPAHPLRDPAVVAEIERAASQHLGRRWASQGLTDLAQRHIALLADAIRRYASI